MEVLVRTFRVSPPVLDKANEFVRRVQVKCSSSIQPSCVAAVCLELACRIHAEPIDKQQLQKCSGTSSKNYTKHLQIIEKLLNLDSRGTLQDLAIRFGCLEAKEAAQEILASYKKYFAAKYTSSQYDSIDFTNPLYSTAALYTACGLLKIRCDRSKLVSAASTSRSMFQNVYEEMKKNIPESLAERVKGINKRRKRTKETVRETEEVVEIETKEEGMAVYSDWPVHFQEESWDSRCLSNPFTDDYKSWRDNILKKAR